MVPRNVAESYRTSKKHAVASMFGVEELGNSFRMSVNFYQTVWHHILEDRILLNNKFFSDSCFKAFNSACVLCKVV
jgi:hypothetical protein